MARPNKEGLNYFSLDCHMDDKIALIEAEFGLKGFAIVVKLWQKIYAGRGYYCEWNDDVSLLFARKLSLGGEKNLIDDVISASIKRNIFSGELYHRYGILTSSGIQKRYLEVAKGNRRKLTELKKEYLLVCVDGNEVNVDGNPVNVDINVYGNPVNADINPQSKVNESKLNKSKERDTPIPPLEQFEEFFDLYPKTHYGKPRKDTEHAYIDALSAGATEEGLVNAARNYAEHCLITGAFVRASNNFFKNCFFEQFLPGNYKKPPSPKQKGGQFGSFEQNDYDFAQLEKDILSN